MSTHRNLGCLYVDTDGVIRFGFNSLSPGFVTGTDLLAQNIIIRLFTTQTSNAFDGDIGGSLYDIVGNGYVVGDEDNLREDFTNAFAFVESQIIEEQLVQNDLDSYEKLSKIEVESVEYNTDTKAWDIQVRVLTEGGTVSTFLLNT